MDSLDKARNRDLCPDNRQRARRVNHPNLISKREEKRRGREDNLTRIEEKKRLQEENKLEKETQKKKRVRYGSGPMRVMEEALRWDDSWESTRDDDEKKDSHRRTCASCDVSHQAWRSCVPKSKTKYNVTWSFSDVCSCAWCPLCVIDDLVAKDHHHRCLIREEDDVYKGDEEVRKVKVAALVNDVGKDVVYEYGQFCYGCRVIFDSWEGALQKLDVEGEKYDWIQCESCIQSYCPTCAMYLQGHESICGIHENMEMVG